ncbi:MAG: two-component regulator propeller domain-containing protein, partial [Bacteroidota bacterium]
MDKRIFWILGGWMLVLASLSAQHQDLRFGKLDLASGLGNPMVHQVCQDLEGFIWAATGNGLYRFDGIQWREFLHDPQDASSLSHNHIRALLVDQEGYIWAGTSGGGLNRIHPQTYQVTRFFHDSTNTNSLSNNEVLSLLEDQHGQLWVGTEQGLNRLNPARNQWTRFLADKDNP